MFRGKRTARVELVGGPNDGDIAEAKIDTDNSLMAITIVNDRYVFWRYRFGRDPQMSWEPMNTAKLAPRPEPKRKRRRKEARDEDG